ncbi:unnamed protein product [Heterobilharzia americana]|nr:unnamed protein product [Heterobilharzia americana]
MTIFFELIIQFFSRLFYSQIAVGFGQITLGEPKFRSFDTDYCLASIFSHGMLIALLMTSRIGFTITKIGKSGPPNKTNHVYDIF